MKYFVYSEEKKLDAMSKSESDAHRREGYRIATKMLGQGAAQRT